MMLKTQYTYQVAINFDLTDADFELLTGAMKNYSDTKWCTIQGEFWYGNMNRHAWRKEKPEDYLEYPPFSATTRQMGLVVKSLEPYMSGLIFDKEKQERGRKLYYELFTMQKAAIEYGNELHAMQEITK